jgi:putative endonuclease
MSYFVYVLYSENRKQFYKGFTENVERRLYEHNNDLGRYTAGKGPWQLIIVEKYDTKREALIREKALKKCKSEYFDWLKKQPSNIAFHFTEVG